MRASHPQGCCSLALQPVGGEAAGMKERSKDGSYPLPLAADWPRGLAVLWPRPSPTISRKRRDHTMRSLRGQSEVRSRAAGTP